MLDSCWKHPAYSGDVTFVHLWKLNSKFRRTCARRLKYCSLSLLYWSYNGLNRACVMKFVFLDYTYSTHFKILFLSHRHKIGAFRLRDARIKATHFFSRLKIATMFSKGKKNSWPMCFFNLGKTRSPFLTGRTNEWLFHPNVT